MKTKTEMVALAKWAKANNQTPGMARYFASMKRIEGLVWDTHRACWMCPINAPVPSFIKRGRKPAAVGK